MKRNRHARLEGDVRDRGMVKWQGMMLPEHVRMLRELQEEQERVEQPPLSDSELAAIQEELELALARRCEVQIKVWQNGRFHFHRGTITAANSARRTIRLEDPFSTYEISAAEIVSIHLIS